MAQAQARSVQDRIAAFPAKIVVDIEHLHAETKTAILTPGERGYLPIYSTLPRDFIEKMVIEEFGCRAATKAEQAAAISGSMFGWDVPLADPALYDENGIVIPKTRR